ncbi:YslB family protein [Bacillus tuaregi]|uniref:YslB family protein n=1 Tax=Bacillus tuaregi TaxID=1816695 RepID=UPI000A04D9C7|nr:YslB family protein [Bacillus tuaregi]
MSKNTATEVHQEVTIEETVPAFGYELIREVLLPEILGDDTPEILYWAGKKLARKFPLSSLEEIIDFFHQAGWGHLTILKESKNELELELSSSIILNRMQDKKSRDSHHFQLEAGFLAEQLEMQKQVISEAFEHPRKKSAKVHFTIKWDKKDIVS